MSASDTPDATGRAPSPWLAAASNLARGWVTGGRQGAGNAAQGGVALREPAPAPHPLEGAGLGRGGHERPPSEEADRLGYEPDNVAAGGLARLALVSAVVVFGLVIGMMMMLERFRIADRAAGPPPTEIQRTAVVPPLPHLQAQPFADLRMLRAHENELLDNYAWLGQDHARARIPVERAKQLAVGRSLDAGP